jgi:cytochrome c556
MKFQMLAGAAVIALGLAACNQEPAPPAAEAPPEAPAETAAAPAEPAPAAPAVDPKLVIETRQTNLKDMGAAFKTISDETKKGSPDMAAIIGASERVKAHATEIGNWFPAGTGPEAGIKTEALAKIWEDRTTFDAAVVKLQEEAGKLQAAAVSGDAAAVKAQFPATGGACKNCHDTFRMKKE